MKNIIRRIPVLLVAFLLAMPGGFGENQNAEAETATKQTRVGFYLDTVISLTAYTEHPELLDAALEECGRYEKLLSRTIEGSDVWRINHAEGKAVDIDPETADILRTAAGISEKSGGVFDVTVAPASVLWDFRSEEKKVPDPEQLKKAAEKIDWRKVELEGNRVTLPAGMMIDLGGIAKGYIADAVKKKLEAAGIESAILSFGGNIVAIGLKPDGSPWRVGVQDIDEPTGKSMLVSRNYGGSTVTSGIYERGFQADDGNYYHHILDTETGWPIQNDLASVTIFSESSMTGDALSTTAFALGMEKGAALIESMEGVEALFIKKDRSVYGTGGVGYFLEEGTAFQVISPSATEQEEAPDTNGEGRAAEETAELVLLIQVRREDPAPGYIFLQDQNRSGFLPLPEEGEKIQEICVELGDGSLWRNVIRMTPEGFSMQEANCEGQDCVLEGEVTLENMHDRLLWNMVICAPHRLTLSLYTPEEAEMLSRRLMGN
ncbi:MAG: FAD:protein FMN transferase [Clostridia bacterium]|nr:FAD:protein FMN transferase [Clostridia bacterium]